MVDGQEPPCAPAPARALRLYCGKKPQHQGWDVEAQRRTANDLRQGKSLACRGDQGRAQIGRKAGRLKCCPLTRSDVKSRLPSKKLQPCFTAPPRTFKAGSDL